MESTMSFRQQALDVFPENNIESFGVYDYDSLANLIDETTLPRRMTLQRTTWISAVDIIAHYIFEQEKSFTAIIPDIKPIIPWKPAKTGTVEEFDGALGSIAPELKQLSEEELEKIMEEARRR